MNILDYLFYRVYMMNKRKNKDPFIKGVLLVCMYIFALTLPIFCAVKNLFYDKSEMGRPVIYSLAIPVVCLVGWRYNKRKELILKEYKECKYNDIPNWLFFILVITLWVLLLGVSINFHIHFVAPYMEIHNLMGYFR